jgi:Protein of unknown function (DUF2630)
MKDESILKHIDKLVQEEQDLYRKEERSPEETKRLQQLEVELDQGWDLLRQRRAKREFGKDPDQAEVRPAEVVEDYEN